MDFVPANQKVPAYYLNRTFSFQFNLPKVAPLADATRSFPSIGTDNALALATVALARLETALAGQAQASDAAVAGSVAAWGAEVAAARADVADALAAVKAAFPAFETAADVVARLTAAEAAGDARAALPAPSQMDVDWATA